MDAAQQLAYFELAAGYKCMLAVIYRIDVMDDTCTEVKQRYYGSHFREKLTLANISRLKDHASGSSSPMLQVAFDLVPPERILYWLEAVVLLPALCVGARCVFKGAQKRDAHLFFKRLVEQHYINQLSEHASKGGPRKLNVRDEVEKASAVDILGVVARVQVDKAPFYSCYNYTELGVPCLDAPVFTAGKPELWHVRPEALASLSDTAPVPSVLQTVKRFLNPLRQATAADGEEATAGEKDESPAEDASDAGRGASEATPPHDAPAAASEKEMLLFHIYVHNGRRCRDAAGELVYLRLNYKDPPSVANKHGSTLRSLAYLQGRTDTYPLFIERYSAADLSLETPVPLNPNKPAFSNRKDSLARFTTRAERTIGTLLHTQGFEAAYAKWAG